MANSELLLGFGLLALAAVLTTVATPKKPGWNNSRAATQRDLADVLAGRGRRDGRADQAIVFAVVLMLGTLAFVAIS